MVDAGEKVVDPILKTVGVEDPPDLGSSLLTEAEHLLLSQDLHCLNVQRKPLLIFVMEIVEGVPETQLIWRSQ